MSILLSLHCHPSLSPSLSHEKVPYLDWTARPSIMIFTQLPTHNWGFQSLGTEEPDYEFPVTIDQTVPAQLAWVLSSLLWIAPILEYRTSTKLTSSKNQEPHKSNLKAVFRDLSQSAIHNYTALCCSLRFFCTLFFSFTSQ